MKISVCFHPHKVENKFAAVCHVLRQQRLTVIACMTRFRWEGHHKMEIFHSLLLGHTCQNVPINVRIKLKC